MEYTQERVFAIEREIAALPAGSITTKKIKNGTYYYHRVTINGKRRETYVDPVRAFFLKEQIEQRKTLEKELKLLKLSLPKTPDRIEALRDSASSFHTYLRTGDALKNFAAPVKHYQKRDCYVRLQNFLYDNTTEKVMILYGLRRTGKTTLIRQAIAEMNGEDLKKAAFIQVKSTDTLADVNADLRQLEVAGFHYIFMDEVTLMKDFIEGAALFSDIFAASGMKIVLSGTDSLGFLFSEDAQLFDRCLMIHTTFIPYREYERVLGITGIDEYIRYGGTMSLGGVDYNSDSVFATPKRVGEYIDSAIARNIQHSLKCYQGGGHFRSLRELYDKNELTSVINRVVEDMNHRFTVDTLDRIDTCQVTEKLRAALEIRNREEQSVQISDSHTIEIKEYLRLLDLITDIDIDHIPASAYKDTISVIAQPGMRYVQAEELIQSILSDSTFDELDISRKNNILERIRSEVKGRMMEELILLETKLSCPQKRVFKLQFAVGEFDMVIADPETLTCRIYEIKHSDKAVPEQCRHLADEQKCRKTEHRYGMITGKYVIYRGVPQIINGIEYLNAEEYLRTLPTPGF
ncbi:MAG: AAA family ATPase [Lachnospiraceae bacterium]|nr:AAA family ATPase [Lachnospiraceae bacterium]